MDKHKVAIIGAGPAGITCAIQLKRHGVKFELFEKEEVGGYLRNAHLVENYTGFTEIKGLELVEKFKKHLNSLDIKITNKEVEKVTAENEKILLEIEKKTRVFDYLVVASGTRPKKADFGESSRLFYDGHRLFGCQDKTIIIVGAGDAAFDYAINLSKHNKVKLLNRKTKTKSLQLLIDRCLGNENIEYIENTTIQFLKDTDTKVIATTNNSNHSTIEADYIICAIGRKPNMSFMDTSFMKLENKKIFFAGDVKNGDFRQTAISAGDGMMHAMKIIDILRNNK